MPTPSPATSLLYSSLSDDPDLREIVEMFVDEMPDRVATLQRFLEAANWPELRRTAHQLKGAAGSYGFDPITPCAAQLEHAVRDSEPENVIRDHVERLVDMCRRARVSPAG